MVFRGFNKGKSIAEISRTVEKLYSLDLPLPVLKKILQDIERKENTKEREKIKVYENGGFYIHEYTFTDYEEVENEKQRKIDKLENVFESFCAIHKYEINKDISSVFKFIENHKLSLSRYLTTQPHQGQNLDFTIEAKFVEFIRHTPELNQLVHEIYLGSIISTYLEYDTTSIDRKLELLLDTNFLISLLDLNTVESTSTCQKLISVARSQGYTVSIMSGTIDESQNLLYRKAEDFDRIFLSKRINPDDIYNACERKGLKRSDLQKIADNLEDLVKQEGINIIENVAKLEREAKKSPEFKKYKNIRQSDKSALHDATAVAYVRDKRGKKIKKFVDANCWFVHNSISDTPASSIFKQRLKLKGHLPEEIKVDDLLNIL